MQDRKNSPVRSLLRGGAAFVLAVVATLALFLFLPLMQSIGNPLKSDSMIRSLDTAVIQPPPPPPEAPEPEPEEEPPPPPQLTEEAPPLDLQQLELALNPSFGGEGVADFTIDIAKQLGGANDGAMDKIFSLAELDQRPRVIFQRVPNYPPELRRQKRQGTVYVVFRVDTTGRVVNPKVQKSTDPAFEGPALEAVKQWKFEPGTRNGDKVQFKMRIPITFNAG